MLNISHSDIFHVHTYRCGHAENIQDECYIKKAISAGASGIWFTDHAPFPGDPFGGRMKYSELFQTKNSLVRRHAINSRKYYPCSTRL